MVARNRGCSVPYYAYVEIVSVCIRISSKSVIWTEHISKAIFTSCEFNTVSQLVQKFELCACSYLVVENGQSEFRKVKWSRYRPGVAQRVGRGIALLFHNRSTRRGWVVSSTPRPHFTPGKDPVPIVQEAGWAPWPVWTGGKSRPHRDNRSL